MKSDLFSTINVNGHTHVLKIIKDRDDFYKELGPNQIYILKKPLEKIPNPNYQGTGLALCGVLKNGETLEGWKKWTGKNE